MHALHHHVIRHQSSLLLFQDSFSSLHQSNAPITCLLSSSVHDDDGARTCDEKTAASSSPPSHTPSGLANSRRASLGANIPVSFPLYPRVTSIVSAALIRPASGSGGGGEVFCRNITKQQRLSDFCPKPDLRSKRVFAFQLFYLSFQGVVDVKSSSEATATLENKRSSPTV